MAGEGAFAQNLLIVAIAVIGVAVFLKMRRQKVLEQGIAALPNFRPALRFERRDSGSALLLDPDSEQFGLVGPRRAVRVYGFGQLVAVEIERNGVALEKANRGSAMLGAAVGGALLGPVGLLLGGLTGSKRKVELVKRLALRLYTNDLHAPFVEAVFFEHKSGLKPADAEVRKAAVQLEEWYGRFLTILNGQKQVAAASDFSSPKSTSDFGRRRALVSGQ